MLQSPCSTSHKTCVETAAKLELLIRNLSDGVHMTCLMESCLSGTTTDLPEDGSVAGGDNS